MKFRNQLIVTLAALLSMQSAIAGDAKVDPCSLVTTAEVEASFGKLKAAAKSGEDPTHSGGVRCNFDNESGSWLTISIYKPTSWGMDKGMMPNELVPIAGMGDEAFSTKVGTDAEVYIKKGEKVLLVRTSAGSAVAKTIAQKAFPRWK